MMQECREVEDGLQSILSNDTNGNWIAARASFSIMGSMNHPTGFLSVQGTDVVDGDNQKIILKGVGPFVPSISACR
jgi:hypothetical protein